MQRQNRFSIIIFLVMALSILHSSKALKCYASSFDGLTMEKIEDREMERMKCPPTKPLCVKFSSKVYVDIGGCAVENFCKVAKDDWNIIECHECKTDLCNVLGNASTKNTISTITIVISELVVLFWSIQ